MPPFASLRPFDGTPFPPDRAAGRRTDDPEAGARYAEVLIDAITLVDPRPYTYAVPEPWRGKILPGMAVLVPFGPKRGVAGYVTALTDTPPEDHEARPIEDVVAGDVIPERLQRLFLWMAEETLAPLSGVMQTAMPRGTLSRVRRKVVLAVSLEAFRDLAATFTGPAMVLARLLLESEGAIAASRLQTAAKRSGMVLAEWRRKGLIRYHAEFVPPESREKFQLHCSLTPGAFERLTPRQAEIVACLARAGGTLLLAELLRDAGTTAPTVKKLQSLGAVRIHEAPVRRSTVGVASNEALPELTDRQARALEAITAEDAEGATFLLHGVTGSGKTEVYLRAIAHALEAGGGAIVLVPEISLTPQTVRRFRARFGDMIAVLHSHLGSGERYDEWQRIRTGEARVVIGARSAIFAPVTELGLVIIDEEHETSYKQDKTPRYHAREVARERCRLEGARLVLGSATPSVESYQAAVRGEFRLLEMPERVAGRPMPPVAIVDMRQELQDGNRHLFSRSLASALGEALSRGEQAILLLNRRGYSSFVFCRACGYVCRCTRCAVAMTFHAQPPSLRCHYCDALAIVPETCPTCKSPYIRHFGAGTQQIEEAARKLLPEARIVRVDRDTTSRKGSHQELLDAFGRGDYDLLIGTQMVAKGLDFPRVTVVGVMAADGALHLPDFRASEHTFQLLTQVAGRAGRGELPSKVVIQTYSPTHPAIVAAQRHDFLAFFRHELRQREDALYPPYCQLACVILASPNAKDADGAAEELARRLRRVKEIEVLGPVEAPLAMLRGLYRRMVLVKTPELAIARQALRQAVPPCQRPGVRVAIDLDPHHLL